MRVGPGEPDAAAKGSRLTVHAGAGDRTPQG